jgi:FkbM family methyltransferase
VAKQLIKLPIRAAKRLILGVADATGLTIEKRKSNSSYRVYRRITLGDSHLDDIRLIFGERRVRTVFDVGAHVGESALTFAKSFPGATIYSFEPDVDAWKLLCQNTRDLARIRPFNVGFGEDSQTRTFYRNAFDATNSLLPSLEEAGEFYDAALLKHDSTSRVQLMTLDQFRSQNGIGNIDLLKIDTQGYEDRVLEGAKTSLRAAAISMIYLEVNFVPVYQNQASFSRILEVLADTGYQLVGLYERGFGRAPFLVGANALFISRRAAAEMSDRRFRSSSVYSDGSPRC